jgi:hypothetical protein
MAGEELRAEASREEAFDGERTRGLPARPELGRGEPLLRRLGVGICGETLAGAAAGTGAGDSDSDSGGGELKAGLGGSSSSSGGGDLKTGLAGASAFAARAAGTGTGAANFGGSGTGVGFTSGSGSGGGGGTLSGGRLCHLRGWRHGRSRWWNRRRNISLCSLVGKPVSSFGSCGEPSSAHTHVDRGSTLAEGHLAFRIGFLSGNRWREDVCVMIDEIHEEHCWVTTLD